MRKFGLSLVAFLIGNSFAVADVKVMTSIKPIHSLVASVMQGVGTPGLIIEGSNSPHTYTLKPADAAALEQAQVIFWVGHELEAFLEKPLATLGQKATTISLMDAEGVSKLAVREVEESEGHEHHDHGDGLDAHVWLDPKNAIAMVNTIAKTLAAADPEHAATYTTNAAKTSAELTALIDDIETILRPLRGKGFFVFHDAYQYFEKSFNLPSSGAISIHPENPPGAKQIAAMKKRIADGKISCVFSEPQFDDKLITLLLEGSTTKTGTLDPLASQQTAGPDLYVTLIRNLAAGFAGCLAPH